MKIADGAIQISYDKDGADDRCHESWGRLQLLSLTPVRRPLVAHRRRPIGWCLRSHQIGNRVTGCYNPPGEDGRYSATQFNTVLSQTVT
jgi:hypothetical protein